MSLSAFESWLKAHLPEAAASLNSRVDDDHWVVLETESRLSLPGGFITLYRWHDGQKKSCPTGIFYGLRFMPMTEVIEDWRFWAEEAAKHKPADPRETDMVKPGYANRHWIPFATDDGGNFLAIDLDPGPAGTYGQVINMGSDELRHYALAPGALEFVNWMQAELAGGNHRIVDEGGGYSFNTLRPPTQHFLDAAKVIFGKAPVRAATPAASGPPRDSTIGTFFFIRDELARHAPAGWQSLSVEGNISGAKEHRVVSLTHLRQGDGAPLQLADTRALAAAFIELQDRTNDEGWKWRRMRLDFTAATPDKFKADAD